MKVKAGHVMFDQWNSYMRGVIPKDAPRVQIQECRRAFYAGAQAAMGTFLVVGSEDVSEEQGAEWLEALRLELDAFGDAVLAGDK